MKKSRKLSDRVANSALGMFSKRFVTWFELKTLAYYKKYGRNGRAALEIIRRIWKNEKGTILLSPHEAWMIFSLAKAQRGHGGDYAEVGVYRGVSAELICEAKDPATELFLFDTFSGLPEPGASDPRFEAGMFAASEEGVHRRLQRFSGWRTFKGLFPDTAGPIEAHTFSFVHLDMDLYEGTLAALKFFWPRMLPGGIILSHDYSQCEGVARAFEEFFAGHDDYRLIELSVTQVMVVRGNY